MQTGKDQSWKKKMPLWNDSEGKFQEMQFFSALKMVLWKKHHCSMSKLPGRCGSIATSVILSN